VWTLDPQLMLVDAPLEQSHFQPSKSYPHNCQTGRWLTILRAQWSLNMDHVPHFTVGLTFPSVLGRILISSEGREHEAQSRCHHSEWGQDHLSLD